MKTSIEPWDTVCQFWNETYDDRTEILKNPKYSTAEYLKDFLCLSQPNGYQLVCIFLKIFSIEFIYLKNNHLFQLNSDAVLKHPLLNNLEDWTEISEKILSAVDINKKNRCSFVKYILDQLNVNSSLSKSEF